MEFTVQPPTRRCASTGRELKTGERFFGLLVAEGEGFARYDYAAEAWPGPPDQAIAYWTGRVPADDKPRRPEFDDELLADCFHRCDGSAAADKIRFRYVVALLLLRRKRLRLEEEKADEIGPIWILSDPKTGGRCEVRDPKLTEAELQSAQDEVFRLLGWD